MEKTLRRIEKGQPEYPRRLQDLPGMPSCLYVNGRLPEEGKLTVGMVGATNSALKEIAAGWVKKSTLTQELADDPEFLTEIKEMSQVKLSSKLRGVSYEIEEN